MIASGAWKTEYYSDNLSRIGERIDVKNSVNIMDRSIKYHGFMWDQKRFFEKDIDLIKEILPIIVEIDLYNFPLSQYFNKYHFLHNFIIYRFNKQKRLFYCVDPYFQNSVFTLKQQSLFKIVNNFYVIKIIDIANLDINECINQIKLDFKKMSDDRESDMNINLFCQDIINSMDINIEFDRFKNNLSATPILDKLRKIYITRSSSSFVLDEINRRVKEEQIDEASKLIKKSVMYWKFIQSKLLKSYLTRWDRNEKMSIYQAVKQISNIEKKAIEIFLTKTDQ